MSNNVCEFVGPALATVLVLGVGAGEAFAFDAATFVVSAVLLIRMSPRRREAAAGAEVAGGDEDRSRSSPSSGSATREVRARAWVWATLLSASATLFLGLAPWFVLGPVVAEENYGGTDVYGIVTAALGAGTIVGAIAGHPLAAAAPDAARTDHGGALVPDGASCTRSARRSRSSFRPRSSAASASSLFDVWWITALAERIPPDRLSRVSSYDWMVSLGLLPVGYLLAGPLADAVGASRGARRRLGAGDGRLAARAAAAREPDAGADRRAGPVHGADDRRDADRLPRLLSRLDLTNSRE